MNLITSADMPTIHLTTFIAAPVDRVFDLSRNIDVHKQSMTKHQERAVAGITFGMIEKNETVTWRAKHLFKTRFLRSKITEMVRPRVFIDEQAEGDFKMLKHEHHFKACDNGTIMIDVVHFETAYGTPGKWFNSLFLTRYIRKLIQHRNSTIKEFAESEKWKKFLTR